MAPEHRFSGFLSGPEGRKRGARARSVVETSFYRHYSPENRVVVRVVDVLSRIEARTAVNKRS